MTSLSGAIAATSSARRPSGRISGVPQRLHDITVPNSVHFQHVGQQTFMTTAHSQQGWDARPMPFVDGAETVTGSAQIAMGPWNQPASFVCSAACSSRAWRSSR